VHIVAWIWQVNELMEKVEVTISTEFLRLRKFAKGHCSTETNAADNLSGCDMSSGYAYTLISFGTVSHIFLPLVILYRHLPFTL